MSMLLATALAGAVNCWAAAAYRYQVPADLLYAIGSVESSHNPKARAVANDGTYSVGLMQINSIWFPTLLRYSITETQLRDPCINIQVGAWILRQEVDRYGYSWEAIGAYYAGAYNTKNYRWKIRHYREYAARVLNRWQRIRSKRLPPPSLPAASVQAVSVSVTDGAAP